MGAQWKQAGRVENSSKKGALIGKLVKEIIVSAKIGDPNPDNNSRLRAALESARKASVPRDTIERAIKKGSGQLDDGATYETVTYEGFTPHRVPVIVECLTDNKNRTAADVRVLFRKGQMGAVAWMFDRMGVIEATLNQKDVDIESVAIECGAQNVEPLEKSEVTAGQTGARFICDMGDLDTVNKALAAAGWVVTQSEFSYLAKNKADTASLNAEQLKEITDFLTSLDDNDDVHRIYTAM